jgi:hypothetical protein
MDGTVLDKLKISKQKKMLILNAPDEFTDLLGKNTGIVETQFNGRFGFVLIFISTRSELLDNEKALAEAVEGDGQLWVCYPKGTSKKRKDPDCSRDTLSRAIHGFEGIAIIALDNDWSALRLRRTEYIGK